MLVGVGGFFPGDGDFVRSVGVLNGPAEKALELIYPDLTTSHLINLDNRTLRDGTVMPNNTSIRVNAFISRELVMCGFPRHWYRFDFIPGHNYNCVAGDPRLPYQSNFDPNDVMARLGELTLLGRKIQFLERVRVLTRTDDLPRSEAGPILPDTTLSVGIDKPETETVRGLNLTGLTLVSSSDPELKIVSQSVAKDGNSVTFELCATGAQGSGPYQLQAISPHGFALLHFRVQVPHVDTTSITLQAGNSTAAGKLTGEHLDGATLTWKEGNGLGAIVPTPVSSTSIEFTADTSKAKWEKRTSCNSLRKRALQK